MFAIVPCIVLLTGCMTGPHDFTFVSRLAFLPHCGCCGRMILHLSPMVSSFVAGALAVAVGELAACLHLSLCLSPCLDTLGRMILHLFPCVSPFLLCVSPLVSAYSGYAWPYVLALVSTCLFACLPAWTLLARCSDYL